MSTFKSIGAIFLGFITVVVLSVGTDFVLETMGIFPPQSEPGLYTGGLLFIALVYRVVYTVAGGYVTAKLAPKNPIRHVIILGIVGTIAGSVGVVVAWDLTPHHWYPIAIAVTALPSTWLGGKLKAGQNPLENS